MGNSTKARLKVKWVDTKIKRKENFVVCFRLNSGQDLFHRFDNCRPSTHTIIKKGRQSEMHGIQYRTNKHKTKLNECQFHFHFTVVGYECFFLQLLLFVMRHYGHHVRWFMVNQEPRSFNWEFNMLPLDYMILRLNLIALKDKQTNKKPYSILETKFHFSNVFSCCCFEWTECNWSTTLTTLPVHKLWLFSFYRNVCTFRFYDQHFAKSTKINWIQFMFFVSLDLKKFRPNLVCIIVIIQCIAYRFNI